MSTKIKTQHSSITELEVDAIVSPGNQKLLAGGGVCGEIFKKAGISDMRKACRELGFCGVGQAVITPGFSLPAKFIIHTVGPQWTAKNKEELLENSYRNCLLKAESNNFKSIAFPVISAGSHGFPPEIAIKTAVSTVKKYFNRYTDSKITEVLLVSNDIKMFDLLNQQLLLN